MGPSGTCDDKAALLAEQAARRHEGGRGTPPHGVTAFDRLHHGQRAHENPGLRLADLQPDPAHHDHHRATSTDTNILAARTRPRQAVRTSPIKPVGYQRRALLNESPDITPFWEPMPDDDRHWVIDAMNLRVVGSRAGPWARLGP